MLFQWVQANTFVVIFFRRISLMVSTSNDTSRFQTSKCSMYTTICSYLMAAGVITQCSFGNTQSVLINLYSTYFIVMLDQPPVSSTAFIIEPLCMFFSILGLKEQAGAEVSSGQHTEHGSKGEATTYTYIEIFVHIHPARRVDRTVNPRPRSQADEADGSGITRTRTNIQPSVDTQTGEQ